MRYSPLVLSLSLVLAACGSEESPPPSTSVADPEPEVTTAPESPAAEPTEPTEADEPAAPTGPTEPTGLIGAVPTTVVLSSAAGRDPDATARRLFDGDLTTAWSSQPGDLVGAFVKVTVPEGTEVTAVALTAGYVKEHRGEDLFTANQRVEAIRVLRGETEVGRFELDVESRELQTFPLEGGGGEWTIEVAALRDGAHEGWYDVSISELQLIGRPPGSPTEAAPVEVEVWDIHDYPALRERVQGDLPEEVTVVPFQTFYGTFGDEPLAQPIPFEPGACYSVFGRVHTPAPSGDEDSEAPMVQLTLRGATRPASVVDAMPGAFLFRRICLETGRLGSLGVEGGSGAIAITVARQEELEADRDHYVDSANWAEGDDVGEPGTDPDAGPLLGSAGGLELTSLVLGGEREDGVVTQRRVHFAHPEQDRIYCEALLRNGTGEATEIHIAYEAIDAEPSDNFGPSFRVPARERYRTFSHRGTVVPPGRYRCVVRTADGELLGQHAYDVLPRTDR